MLADQQCFRVWFTTDTICTFVLTAFSLPPMKRSMNALRQPHPGKPRRRSKSVFSSGIVKCFLVAVNVMMNFKVWCLMLVWNSTIFIFFIWSKRSSFNVITWLCSENYFHCFLISSSISLCYNYAHQNPAFILLKFYEIFQCLAFRINQ